MLSDKTNLTDGTSTNNMLTETTPTTKIPGTGSSVGDSNYP